MNNIANDIRTITISERKKKHMRGAIHDIFGWWVTEALV